MNYIKRDISERIRRQEKYYPVIVITGPRQVGKTTLCKHLWPDFTYYNLEDVELRNIIREDPKKFIFGTDTPIIIDEIQHIPDLFSYIQICVDENPERKFVITGSSDFALMENITQSLAGRAALFTLLPFSFNEIESYMSETNTDRILYNGFYPGVIVRQIPPNIFFSNYCSTYVERDVRKIKAVENLDIFQTFMKILAGRTSTEFNAASISAEIGVTSPTIKSWLGILKTSYLVFTLSPYHTNIEKRLTKTPKVYFYDTGLLCFLLGISDPEQLATHPLRGAVFENLIISELVKQSYNNGDNASLYFYRENKGREVDALRIAGNTIDLYEVKSSSTYNTSFKNNLTYLKKLLGDKVRNATVVYDGTSYPPEIINFRALS